MQGQSQHWPRATAPRATLSEDLRVLRQLEGAIDRLDSFEAEAPQKRLSLGQMARGLEQRLARLRAPPRG